VTQPPFCRTDIDHIGVPRQSFEELKARMRLPKQLQQIVVRKIQPALN
jgi:hypothetical protein